MPDQNDETYSVEDVAPVSGVVTEIINKINESKNILVALSKNPSVDELSAAIGVSMYLNRIGKNTTAIYSGTTPDALEFLKPDDTFERSADVLQDFVIALDKDKADHLRYKVDGDFVKIYITPYKTKVSEGDLNYSYGDFNVDLVLAMDVANGIELDSALREHGRIMHDAVIVNLTTSAPGKFGEIEWSDQSASSVSEMIAGLLFEMDEKPDKDESTAFLTGIVAATNSFSNARTSSETMKVSSKLMDAGANQQLVSMHVTAQTENELYEAGNQTDSLNIAHEEVVETVAPVVEEPVIEEPVAEAPVVEQPVVEMPNFEEQPVVEQSVVETPSFETPVAETPVMEAPVEQPVEGMVSEEPSYNDQVFGTQGLTIEPMPQSEDLAQPVVEETFEGADDTERYGQMLEDALNESTNPATVNAPVAPVEPEINGVPVMNYEPAVDEILTPPPVPPVNVEVAPTEAPMVAPEPMPEPMAKPEPQPVVEPQPVMESVVPEMSVVEPQPANEPQPVAPQPTGQAYVPPAPDDIAAFKIPNVN
ncbi:hypothetical protein IKX64_02700 [Candidatus Saccharibacteria bacterium]|nr:hypothetical protein [Candidatus Saccharibacteria bacterium]